MKYRIFVSFIIAAICCIKISGQCPQIILSDMDTFVVSAYIKVANEGYCGGHLSFMFVDGMFYRFINNTHSNKYVYKESLCKNKNHIDETIFDYDEIKARIENDYTYNLNFGEFEFMPKGENVVSSKYGFYEKGDTLFAIYKYKGRVLEYYGMSYDNIYSDGIDVDCPCDNYYYKPHNINEEKFIINYYAEKLDALSTEEINHLFSDVKWSAIKTIYLTICE